MKEEELFKLILFEFNWRWQKYIKNQTTQQQFSRDFRKVLKEYQK